jgi:hypothetical protein
MLSLTAIADKVPSRSNLHSFTNAASKLSRGQYIVPSPKWHLGSDWTNFSLWGTYGRVLVVDSRINHSNLHSLPENSLVVQRLDPRVLMYGVVRRCGPVRENPLGTRRRQLHQSDGPCLRDRTYLLQGVNVVRIGLQAEARKDVRVKRLEDLPAIGLDLCRDGVQLIDLREGNRLAMKSNSTE